MDKLYETIEIFQERVFEYQSAGIAEAFLELVNVLEGSLQHIAPEKHQSLNQLLHLMLSAYQMKDYLLVADLAEYELKPLALHDQSREN